MTRFSTIDRIVIAHCINTLHPSGEAQVTVDDVESLSSDLVWGIITKALKTKDVLYPERVLIAQNILRHLDKEHLSSYEHQLNALGTGCAEDCPACKSGA